MFLENLSRCSIPFPESDGAMNVKVSLVKCLGSLYLSHVSSHVTFFSSVFSGFFPVTSSHEEKMLFPSTLHSEELRHQGNEY